MPNLATIYQFTATVVAVLTVIVLLRKLSSYALARIRLKERDRVWEHVRLSFVADMATNHLPHIYDALKLLAEDRGLTLREPPPIRWMLREPEVAPAVD